MLKKSHKKRFKSNIDVKDNNSRNLVLSSDITASSVADIIESILDINTLDDELVEDLQDYEREPIKLVVNSFGGSVYDGFALIGVMENSKTPIHTYCYGSAMSMALLILVSGHKRFGHRLSTFMYHECLDNPPYDKLTTLKENLEETKRIMKVYDDQLLLKTKLKRKQLDDTKKIKLDWYMSPEEALSYKIIDQII